MISFINTAYAATATDATANPAAQGGGSQLFIMLVVFIIISYFMLWRPQSKRAQQQKNLMNALAKDDEVITIGGMLGKIIKVEDQFVSLMIADNVEIKIQKNAINAVLPKGTMQSMNK